MHARRIDIDIDIDESGRRAGAVPHVRRREAGAYRGCAGFAVWPIRGRAELAPLQRGRQEFDALALEAARLGVPERVAFLNAWFNQLVAPLADDPCHDDWTTPCETLARGTGDREDSAIGKFFLLPAWRRLDAQALLRRWRAQSAH